MTRKMFNRNKRGKIQLQELDVSVIAYIASRTYRRADDIHRRFPQRSPKKHAERLRHLFDHGYVDRPRAQELDHLQLGRTHYIYALGNAGASLLSERLGYNMPKSNWTQKNRLVQRPHLQHTLRIGDVADAVEFLPENQPHILPISSSEILAASPPRTLHDQHPWAWRARTQDTNGTIRNLVTKPDYVFGLDHTQLRKRFYFWVECDRRTEPVVRTNNNQTSVIRKYVAYEAGFRANLQGKRYALGNIRFVTLTTSQQRIDTMIDALRCLNLQDASMFLFAESDALRNAPDLLQLDCRDGNNEHTTLLPNSSKENTYANKTRSATQTSTPATEPTKFSELH